VCVDSSEQVAPAQTGPASDRVRRDLAAADRTPQRQFTDAKTLRCSPQRHPLEDGAWMGVARGDPGISNRISGDF
jgi:hypothetical protein